MFSNLLKGDIIYFCVQLLVSLVVTDVSQSFIVLLCCVWSTRGTRSHNIVLIA